MTALLVAAVLALPTAALAAPKKAKNVILFIADAGVAKRASAAVAIAMLFACGFAWGRYAGLKAWRTGLVMVLLGGAVEAVVIALGG